MISPSCCPPRPHDQERPDPPRRSPAARLLHHVQGHDPRPRSQDDSYVYLGFTWNGAQPPRGRWSEGTSIDGKGQFSIKPMKPQGREPTLGPAREHSGAQSTQIGAR
jgi:hypothetical protein